MSGRIFHGGGEFKRGQTTLERDFPRDFPQLSFNSNPIVFTLDST